MSRRLYVVVALAALLAVGTITTDGDGKGDGKGDGRGESKGAQPSPVKASVAALDALCEATWRERGVEPSGAADPLLIARRLSLALTGTVPSLQEIRALEGLPSEARVEHHLEALLAGRRFADYFAERLGRAFVGVDDGPFLVFRRRRFIYWLSDAIHDGVGYDQLVEQMIAGTGLWTDRPETNFITAHERDPVQLTARTMRAFLGMRLDCAQCHDHPFSHWKQADFASVAAFYAGIEQGVTGIADSAAAFAPTGRMMMDPGAPAATPRVPFGEAPEADTLRQRLARWVTASSAFERAIANRVWTLMLGRSMTEGGVDDIEGNERIAGALALLGGDFAAHGHDLRRLIRVIAHSRAFSVSSAAGESQAETHFASFPVVPLRAEQIAGALVQISNLHTIDADSHFLLRLMRVGNESDFVRRYGDAGEDEMREQAGTLMQRLVMMNGRVVRERTEANLFSAAGRIAKLAPDAATSVRAAFAVVLTRAPSSSELQRFEATIDKHGDARDRAVEDMMWALVNTTEMSWNH